MRTQDVVKSDYFHDSKERKIRAECEWGSCDSSCVEKIFKKNKHIPLVKQEERKFDYKISNWVGYQRAFKNQLKENLSRQLLDSYHKECDKETSILFSLRPVYW